MSINQAKRRLIAGKWAGVSARTRLRSKRDFLTSRVIGTSGVSLVASRFAGITGKIQPASRSVGSGRGALDPNAAFDQQIADAAARDEQLLCVEHAKP
ncbi:hypothetical protein [Paraburkholderia sp.]|uniref:hypothetical protein n=1 Tax=Paraburkholderia sp. TaxID=1926495 RepID=UPI0039C90810